MHSLALGAYNTPNIRRLLLAPTTKLVDNVGQNKNFHTEHNEDGEPPRVLITGIFYLISCSLKCLKVLNLSRMQYSNDNRYHCFG